MEYNIRNFNGEINNKLSSNFKIPLKAPSETKKNEGNGTANKSNKNEVFSSPLVTCEHPVNESVITLPEKLYNAEEESKKRKRTEAEINIFGRNTSYPDELNALIQPLHCNVCDAKLSSMKTAKEHYMSKTHDKKLTNWLYKWSQETGEPLPKLVTEGPSGPGAFHCDVCDLPLTSIQHASQHYNGKKHTLVISNISRPSGSGYYDVNGKWIRTQTKVTDTTRRFTFGEGFLKEDEQKIVAEKKKEKLKEIDQSKLCDICNVSVTSNQQMEMHLKGSKHAKKLKLLDKPPYAEPNDTLLASVNSHGKNDVSMYRTPTGSYYCKACNISISEAVILLQHLESKKHIKTLKKDVTHKQTIVGEQI